MRAAESLRRRRARILWNVAHYSAERVADLVRHFVVQGLPDDQVIAWCPQGEIPLVVTDRLLQEEDVPSALGGTVFDDVNWWDGVRGHARETSVMLLIEQDKPCPLGLEMWADSVWVTSESGALLLHRKSRVGRLMASWPARPPAPVTPEVVS